MLTLKSIIFKSIVPKPCVRCMLCGQGFAFFPFITGQLTGRMFSGEVYHGL